MTAVIDMLLSPISTENPAGLDLRADNTIDSIFYKAKDARNEARQTERRVLLDPTLTERSDWKQVQKLCTDILQHHSKDIEVTTWLIEALLREQGLTGLANGFRLLSELLEQYWETIYPITENQDIAERVIAITSLNGEDYDGTLIQPLYQVAITQNIESGAYLLWHYQQAMENAKYVDGAQIEKKRSQGSVFINEIKAAVAASGAEFYQQLLKNVDEAKQAFSQLQQVLLSKCGTHAPPSSQIKAALDTLNEYVRFLVNEAPFAGTVLASNTPAVINENKSTQAVNELAIANDITNFPITSDIQNRKHALDLLQKIATFFRQTEPQSPLPHLLDRAVRWGNMPFAELLREIIKDEGVRSSAYELMGLDTK